MCVIEGAHLGGLPNGSFGGGHPEISETGTVAEGISHRGRGMHVLLS